MMEQNKQTFEYFSRDEFFLTGRFKEYADQLWTQNKIQESMVKRLVDVYAIAAILGLKERRKYDADPSEDKSTVQLKQIADNRRILGPIMKLVLLLDESRGLDAEARIRSAFSNPENEEEYRQNTELFNSYARGGIEILYERLITRPNSMDELHEDARVDNILALIRDVSGNDAPMKDEV